MDHYENTEGVILSDNAKEVMHSLLYGKLRRDNPYIGKRFIEVFDEMESNIARYKVRRFTTDAGSLWAVRVFAHNDEWYMLWSHEDRYISIQYLVDAREFRL